MGGFWSFEVGGVIFIWEKWIFGVFWGGFGPILLGGSEGIFVEVFIERGLFWGFGVLETRGLLFFGGFGVFGWGGFWGYFFWFGGFGWVCILGFYF